MSEAAKFCPECGKPREANSPPPNCSSCGAQIDGPGLWVGPPPPYSPQANVGPADVKLHPTEPASLAAPSNNVAIPNEQEVAIPLAQYGIQGNAQYQANQAGHYPPQQPEGPKGKGCPGCPADSFWCTCSIPPCCCWPQLPLFGKAIASFCGVFAIFIIVFLIMTVLAVSIKDTGTCKLRVGANISCEDIDVSSKHERPAICKNGNQPGNIFVTVEFFKEGETAKQKDCKVEVSTIRNMHADLAAIDGCSGIDENFDFDSCDTNEQGICTNIICNDCKTCISSKSTSQEVEFACGINHFDNCFVD